jgi:DNA-binding LacI/PurR family transcriptional regulator
MPNQRDVARAANLSSATVSRYLKDPHSVNPKAAERIEAAIKALSYKVDYSAQCLKTGRFNHIGILAPGIGPFYWEAFSWIQWQLNEEGYFSTLFYTRDVNTLDHSYRDRIPPFLNKRQLDGIIFFPLLNREDEEIIDQLVKWGHPFVIADRQVSNSNYAQVCMNNYASGAKAAEEFLRKGHRDFIFIWGRHESPSAQERFRGFSDRLRQEGIELAPERQLDGEYRAETTYLNARAKLSTMPHFTAVFASNDASAIGFMRAAAEAGMRCPEDYSIIGFDNNLEFAPYVMPPLASFHQPVPEFGRAAASMLLSMLKGEQTTPGKMVFEPEFIDRESLAPAP